MPAVKGVDPIDRRKYPDGSLIWGYARVSTDEQVESGLGLSAQRQDIERYSKRLEEDLDARCALVVEEPMGISALKRPWLTRPAGIALNDVMTRGDHMVLGRLDRCFRSPLDFYNTFTIWEERGIRVHLADMKIDLSTGFGKFIAGFLVMAAEWQSRYISERTKEALEQKRKAGKRGPGGISTGYDVVQGDYLIPNKLDMAVLRLVLKWKPRNPDGRHCGGKTWKKCSQDIEEILAKREGRKPIPHFWQEKRQYPMDRLIFMVERYEDIGTLMILEDEAYQQYISRPSRKGGAKHKGYHGDKYK